VPVDWAKIGLVIIWVNRKQTTSNHTRLFLPLKNIWFLLSFDLVAH